VENQNPPRLSHSTSENRNSLWLNHGSGKSNPPRLSHSSENQNSPRLNHSQSCLDYYLQIIMHLSTDKFD
jgi:hypothetical protein